MKKYSQEILYTRIPNLSEIYKLEKPYFAKKIKINVWRNTGVESITKTIDFYAADNNFNIDWKLNYYDNSLIFSKIEAAKLDILMVDIDEYKNNTLQEFLSSKLSEIKEISENSAIVIFSKTQQSSTINLVENLKKIHNINILVLQDIEYLEEINVFDERLISLTGSWVSISAVPIIARKIFHQTILSYMKQPIKIVALDLDNTLYDGILLEDGIDNLTQNNYQIELIKIIKELKAKGVIVACVSRNEHNDYNNLMQNKEKINLTEDFFDFAQVSWRPKTQMINELLNKTKLGEESLIYVDDNITEIFLVNERFPDVNLVLGNNKETTLIKFKLLLYLVLGGNHKENSIRVLDLKSNKNRENIFNQYGIDKAKDVLQVELEFYVNNSLHYYRCSELSLKTNQFNFNFSRWSEQRVKDFAVKNFVISVNLKDKFADSGIIATLFIQKNQSNMIIEEFCISCRALGRGLENEIFFSALKFIHNKNNKKIKLKYKKGPRNMPCLEWVGALKVIDRVDYFEIDSKLIEEWSVSKFATLKS